jgi:hypothetical protein
MIAKMHEDEWLDYKQGLHELRLLFAHTHRLMETAIYHGLDVNWLIQGEWPENIAEVHKELRGRGYLK